jgi:transcriptional regulator with XRE-family HTH domain
MPKPSTKKSLLLIAFGETIRDLRKKRQLSQEALADKASLHRTYIGMIERGEKNITLENIQKISKALDIPLFEIFRIIKL